MRVCDDEGVRSIGDEDIAQQRCDGGGAVTPAAAPRVEHLTTDGVFTLDGRSFAVTNNMWLVGDSDEVVVIDPAHDAGTIIASIRDRLLVLPDDTVVRAGHGDTTTIGDEAEDLDAWTARGA